MYYGSPGGGKKVPEAYCIMSENPYCPICPFGNFDTSGCEEFGIFDGCETSCSCTKEKYEKYMKEHKE